MRKSLILCGFTLFVFVISIGPSASAPLPYQDVGWEKVPLAELIQSDYETCSFGFESDTWRVFQEPLIREYVPFYQQRYRLFSHRRM